MRKSTGERMSVIGRRVSELQASPFRYSSLHPAGKKARAGAATQVYSLNSNKGKYSDSRSTSTMTFSTHWAPSKNGSPTCRQPTG